MATKTNSDCKTNIETGAKHLAHLLDAPQQPRQDDPHD
jgi:hypothetical protein